VASVTYDALTKSFGSTVAVRDFTVEVPDGEFLVLVGPSGCGKTTVLRCTAGLEEISRGRLLIGDRLVNDVPAKDRDIAMVFQNYALYPHMSVRANLAFGLKLRHTPKDVIARRVKEVSALLDLEDLLDRRPGQLSGGQRQRVALGRAIGREPDVFLMDEPLSNLDATLRVATRAELVRLHQRLGITTIYVTHDQIEAMTMGDRIVVVRSGAVQQVGSPRELFERPANLFVAGFIGSPAMNLVSAQLAWDASGPRLWTGQIDIRLTGAPAAAAAGRDEVIMGIRPEHIEVGDVGRAGAACVRAVVEVAEYLGNDELLHARVGAQELLSLAPSDTRIAPGEAVQQRLSPTAAKADAL
jgi:multiple sugar transport system ATP-binding protein